MSQIVTGDAVVLDLRPARVPTRMVADVIDIAGCAALSVGWGYLVDALRGEVSGSLVQAMSMAGYILIFFAFPIALETLTRGRTLGSYAMGVRTVRDDGGTIRLRHALLRWLAFWIVDYAVWTGLVAGVGSMVIHPMSKRLGDLLAGTMVIRVRAPRRSAPLPDGDPMWADWASRLEMSRVTDDLWAAARYSMLRRPMLRKDYRAFLVSNLARQVSQRVSPPPPAGMSPEDFLVTVLAERRRRGRQSSGVGRDAQYPPGANSFVTMSSSTPSS